MNAVRSQSRARRFADRHEAGRALGAELVGLAPRRPIVVALPRGGVPVGFEVARRLDAPLDIALVRKLGAPAQPELGIGAIAEGGAAVLDFETVAALGVTGDQLEAVIAREQTELERRRARYRGRRAAPDVAGRLVLLVDDGLATGVTARAAAKALKQRGAAEVVLAVPVCAAEAAERVGEEVDRLICLSVPRPFLGVGGGYADFSPTPDEEVADLLARSRRSAGEAGKPDETTEEDALIGISRGRTLEGSLRVPPRPVGLVVFVHGSGSSRLSPRNRAVARQLNGAGFATLLFDLLTDAEAGERENVFDIGLLAERVRTALNWATRHPRLRDLPIGLFGASTGAAAALRASVGEEIAAVVSRGGRPDLAGARLAGVRAPTLLIVGSEDHAVLGLNRLAAERIESPCEITVVPGAGHLFDEPGTLATAAEHAAGWFARWMPAPDAEPSPAGSLGEG
jgi:putative phosphoribosyl transferase